MCAGAIMHAQIQRLVYGASDPKRGYTLYNANYLSKLVKIRTGVLEEECSVLLKNFFQERR
jgi:tRNA(adenine34) deaminase